MSTKTGFVHPSEFGFDSPINTKEELVNIAKAINKGFQSSNERAKKYYVDRDGLIREKKSLE